MQQLLNPARLLSGSRRKNRSPDQGHSPPLINDVSSEADDNDSYECAASVTSGVIYRPSSSQRRTMLNSSSRRYDKCRCLSPISEVTSEGDTSSVQTDTSFSRQLLTPHQFHKSDASGSYLSRRFNKSFCFSVLGIQFFAVLLVYLAFLFFWFVG